MTFVDTLLSSNRLVQRRVRLATCSGLERLLLSELEDLSLKFSLLARGNAHVDISTGLDTIWSIIQNSRICRQLYIHVCDPFEAETTRQFASRLNTADWASFIPFSHKLPKPSIKVKSHNSKLYHTGMVRNMVEGVINSHCYRYKQMQGDELPEFMRKRGYVPLCPKITVDIRNNSCQVLADASGDMSERPWHKLSLLEDRISPTASAAMIHEIMARGDLSGKSTVWDPFCHNGSMLFEIFSFLKDERLRVESSNYPLNNFPMSTLLYEHTHLPRSSSLSDLDLNLIGSDPNPDNVTAANELLTKLDDLEDTQVDRLFSSDSESSRKEHGRVSLKFECNRVGDMSLDLSRTLILTNMYYGNKSLSAKYGGYWREFCSFLRSKGSKCPSVYAITPRSFKSSSSLKWETLLVFNNNGIVVELMKLKR